MLRLYTFQVSHFAEKARWALDYKRVPYEERRLLPGPHLAVTRRLSRRTSVPLLLAGGRVVQGSSEIIDFAEQRWLDRPLNPQDSGLLEQALELEGWLDRELGERLRRVFYFYALRQPEIVLQLFTQGGPWWGRLFYKAGLPFVGDRIRKMYAINSENVATDLQQLAAAFKRLDALLEGRKHLVGDHFTRADLTLAALTAPMWQPLEHSTRWPSQDLVPVEIRELRAQYAETRTCAHVLDMYRKYRRPAPKA